MNLAVCRGTKALEISPNTFILTEFPEYYFFTLICVSLSKCCILYSYFFTKGTARASRYWLSYPQYRIFSLAICSISNFVILGALVPGHTNFIVFFTGNSICKMIEFLGRIYIIPMVKPEPLWAPIPASVSSRGKRSSYLILPVEAPKGPSGQIYVPWLSRLKSISILGKGPKDGWNRKPHLNMNKFSHICGSARISREEGTVQRNTAV
jgi:hypothetical protein